MEELKIDLIKHVVEPHGLQVEHAINQHVALFENDLCDADKYDLSKTWRRSWRSELHCSFENASECYIVYSKEEDGVAVFGLTPRNQASAQIWLLQSRSFSKSLLKKNGVAWVHKFVAISREIIGLFLMHYPLLFNFISVEQKNNIRWLKHCGFNFFSCPAVSSEMLLFVQGKNMQTTVNDINLWRAYLGECK